MTLQRWFARRPPANLGGRRVVLWPDTFNNHFHTDVGVAGVLSLERAGWQVEMPQGHVCCGRPLYDYGMLKLARRYLRSSLRVLRPWLRDGVPIVGLEPSCVATFKDELEKLLPHDEDGLRLRELVCHFGEFHERFDVEPPKLAGRAVLWGHCHHKATGGIEPEERLLTAMGLDVSRASGGCCGLAGSWGFEAGHHDLSMRCGEEGIFPAVRDAPADTVIVADGFSCRTQIEQGGTGRRALHLAQVLALADQRGELALNGRAGRHPEDDVAGRRPRRRLFALGRE
jgi:Fe-S oxidoreductase